MENDSLHFAQPLWILAGFVVCAGVAALYLRFDRRRDADLAKLVHPRFRQRLTEGFSPRLRNLKRGLWLLAILLLFTAIARPRLGHEWREVKRKGIDILFAVDTSRSMLAEDLTPNRLERARLGIIDFVKRLEGDRVGLIPFAGSAFALCPLTLDYEAFNESLNAIDTDLIPRQGTDLASAIKEAERLFDETGNNFRVLVLITDGEDLEGSVIDAAKAAAKKGMSIHTVGVGSPDGATIPIRYANGGTGVMRDQSGNVVKTALDEATLKKIAEATEGLYVPLGRGAEGLDTIYQERLRLVPKSELSQRLERIPLERYEWPLGAAIALLLFEFLISDGRRLKKARALPSAARRVKIAPQAAIVALLSVVLSGVSSAGPREVYNEGTKAYTEGDFTKAAESLRASLRTQDLSLQQRCYYNLGNTLYRTGQGALEKDPEATIKTWEESIKAYQDALALDAGDEDAAFNKALVEKKLEELKKQQKQDDKQENQDQKDEQQEDQEKKEEEKRQEDEKQESKEGEDKKDEKEGEKPGEEKQPGDEKNPGEEEKPGDGEDPKEEKPGEGKDSKEGEGPEKSEEQKEAERKEGEPKEGEGQEGTATNERPEKTEMTPEEAKQLLEALRNDERTVIPIPQRSRFSRDDNTTKGKTW
jgi:Ca-activated chloride channel family protein